MFLRVTKQRLRSGAVLEHFQLAESVWDRQKKRSRTQVLYSFGRVDDPAVVERLRKLAHSLLRRCSPEESSPRAPTGDSSMPGRMARCWRSRHCGGVSGSRTSWLS